MLDLDKITTRQVEAALCRVSLYEFFVRAWSIVDPDVFHDNWHISVLCDQVQKAIQGTGPLDVLINVPPGTAKSMIVSVATLPWVWTFNPAWSAIYASGNPRVVSRDSIKARNLIKSSWYRKLFVDSLPSKERWEFADDSDQKTYFMNTKGGFRSAIGADTAITGDRAHALFVDDPLDASDAHSELKKESVRFWWDTAFSNRLKQMGNGSRIVIMQRLAVDDLSGHILEQGAFEHVCLPMEYDPERPDPRDPRTIEGETLFAARFSADVIASEKAKGALYYAGQYQQLPFALGGNIWKAEDWRFYRQQGMPENQSRPKGCTLLPAEIIPDDFDELVTSWDANFKKSKGKKLRDFVAGGLWGRKGSKKYLLKRFRDRTGFIGAIEAILQFAEVKSGKRLRKATTHYIEGAANGPAIIETLEDKLSGIVEINPKDYGDKISRAVAVSPQIRAGNVFLPDGAVWLDEYVGQASAFPNGPNDDEVDQTSQVLQQLAESESSFASKFMAAQKSGKLLVDVFGIRA